MKRLIAILALLAVPALAQYTQVSGQIMDAAGNPYVNAQWTISLVNNTGSQQQVLLSGSPFQQQYGGFADGAGNFSVLIPDSNQITPSGTQWKFTFCQAGGVPQKCFSVTLTITGASETITSQIQAAALPLNAFTGGTVFGGIQATGAILAKSIESVRSADQFTGADMGAKIIAAGADCSDACTVAVPTGTYAIATNETLPAGITLRFARGAILSPNSGVTLTIDSGIDAGNYQIFGGAGTVGFAGNTAIARLPITWWGAIGDGTTDDTTAVQAAMTAGESGVGVVYIPTGTFDVCGIQAGNPTTKVTSGSTQASGPSMIGDARFQSVLQATSGCTGWVIERNNTSGLTYSRFEVNGGGTAKGADFSWFGNGPSTRDVFRDIWVRNYKTEGLDLDNQNDAVIDGIAVDGQNTPTDIAISAVGVGGQIFLSNVQVNNGVANLAAQSGECTNCNFLDGVAISASGTNNWSFVGGQIWPNGSCAGCSGVGTTGIALNLTNSGVPGTAGIFGAGLYFPGAVGMVDLGGNWGGGLTCDACFFGGTVFGTITGTRSGTLPTFAFIQSSLPANIESTSSYNVRITGSGASDQLYSFGYLGGLGNCSAATPPGLAAGGFATCWNYSGSAGETDIFSSKGAASAASFRFYDWNGGATPTLMATLNDSGMTLGASALAVATTSQLPLAGSVTASTTAVTANTCADTVTATVTGATTSMAVSIGMSAAPQAGLRPYAYVSAANTVTFEFCNDTAASITPNAQTVQLRVIQ